MSILDRIQMNSAEYEIQDTDARGWLEELKIDIGQKEAEIAQTVEKSAGYMYIDGSISGVNNPTYFHTSKIHVKDGDLVFARDGNGNKLNIKYVCAFTGSQPVPAQGTEIQSSAGFTVPEGITSVVLTCYYEKINDSFVFIQRTVQDIDVRRNKNKWCLSKEAANVAADERLSIANSAILYNKKNCSYSFWANFDTFSGLTIGHGATSLGASYIEITTAKLLAYQGNGSSAAAKMAEYNLPENFAFSDFVSVNVNVGDSEIPTATVTILTNGGRFIQENVPFVGSRGLVYALPAAAMTNAVLSYSMRDLKQDVFIFGDSYISLNDQNRWPYHVMQAGYTDYLLCGYPGAGAQDILPALQQMISLARPKYIVWLLGMNNPDTETGYNENWKTALDSVLEICENIKATPILATIPNTPTVSNYYKNQYVRQSGYRYIDFAKAVGAEELESHWYNGMLNETETAKVHPTVYGARALAMRLLADLPEIT